jgi:hypothetical protein
MPDNRERRLNAMLATSGGTAPRPSPAGSRGQRERDVGAAVPPVTTNANELVAPIHERMPLILEPENFEAWLFPGEPTAELRAAPKADELEAVPISNWVNSPSHDDPRCMEPLAPLIPTVRFWTLMRTVAYAAPMGVTLIAI